MVFDPHSSNKRHGLQISSIQSTTPIHPVFTFYEIVQSCPRRRLTSRSAAVCSFRMLERVRHQRAAREGAVAHLESRRWAPDVGGLVASVMHPTACSREPRFTTRSSRAPAPRLDRAERSSPRRNALYVMNPKPLPACQRESRELGEMRWPRSLCCILRMSPAAQRAGPIPHGGPR